MKSTIKRILREEIDDLTLVNGQPSIDDDRDEWNIYEDNQGVDLLDYFYEEGFDRKQPYGHDTAFDEGESDGSFGVSNKDYFCKHVGNYHPEMCGRA